MSLEQATRHGLVLRGTFVPDSEDGVPGIENRSAGVLMLFGNAGSSIWPAFSISPEYQDGEDHPLNRWSERIGNELAEAWGGVALFPFGGPPYQPFLRWAARAEQLRSSKLGLLLHPQYGLWHAYRLAVALPRWPEWLAEPERNNGAHACDTCSQLPCLSACPVDAFSHKGYDVERCFNYLDAHPGADCHYNGCAARKACPEGKSYRYQVPHGAFHMQKFYESLRVRFAG